MDIMGRVKVMFSFRVKLTVRVRVTVRVRISVRICIRICILHVWLDCSFIGTIENALLCILYK